VREGASHYEMITLYSTSACSFLLFARDWIVTAKILEFFCDLWYFYIL